MKSNSPQRTTTLIPAQPPHEADELITQSLLYRDWVAEREEILRHKWIESEKAGEDIGFDKALLSWIVRHRAKWRDHRSQSG